jgi:multidrug efflux pump subunit AcrA (membrane-fusion protein)
MSKDLKPKHRLGQAETSPARKAITWTLLLAVCGGGAYAAYRYAGTTTVEVPVATVRSGEFSIGVKTRGELAAVRSMVMRAPQVPNLKIVRLARSGTRVKAGEILVQFDTAQIEQAFLDRSSNVRTIESEVVQLQANHKMVDEQDSMNRTTANYNVQRTELEASKAEVVSQIEGAKTRVDVDVTKGELGQVDASIRAHDVSQQADLNRQQHRKEKAQRDLQQVRDYLSRMVIRAPIDGVVTVLPNSRAQGSSGNFGSTPPAFQEGDTVWFGAPIIEIPDPTSMRIEIRLDEVDRGKIRLGQNVKVRVDALPEREMEATLDWISPIAQVEIKGNLTDKSFPVRATLASVDSRFRPGMSASASIITSSRKNALMIPLRASLTRNGKPAVYVKTDKGFELRPIQIGQRNEIDAVVLNGLAEGERVALEDPSEALKRAKKF